MHAPADLVRPRIHDAAAVEHHLAPIAGPLEHPGVLELCINRPGEVFIETAGGWRREDVPAMDLARCMALANAVATWSSQRVGAQQPLLAATLPGGQRAQFALPPAVPRDTVSLTIRRPATFRADLAALEARGMFARTAPAADALQPHESELLQLLRAGAYRRFLALAVQQRLTMVMSGQTGSGKTTFLKALAAEIPRSERLVTIEDTPEMTLPGHDNAVHLLYSAGQQGVAEVTAQQLLQASLRMRPDRILLAEVRGPECFDFVRAAASGHPGSMTSLHAGSCALAFEQMALMIRQCPAGAGLAFEEIKRLLLLTVDVVVQFGTDGGNRHIRELWYDPQRRLRLAQGPQGNTA